MEWQERYREKGSTPAEAVLGIPRGKHIFIGSGASEPIDLVSALVEQAQHFADNTIVHLMTLGPAPYVEAQFADNFRHNAFFIGANVREAVHEGRADYTPVFLSRIPEMIRSRRMPIDAALIQCSPPDQFGYVNLGLSVDITKDAIEAAQYVVAEINPRVPVIFGAGFVHMDQIDRWVASDQPLIQHKAPPPDEISLEIGRNVASLIEDGSTLQMGIGSIPDATLAALEKHRDLGIWTEMFSDGVMHLVQSGVINGAKKTVHPGRVSSSFVFGSDELYAFLDRNPAFTFHPSDYINDPIRIARQHQMVAINSALEVDMTGQVCADSIGTRFYSGIGGQVDFIRGSSMSPGGKPIIALPSTAKGGTMSRIVPTLTKGAGVVTSRGDVRYVVTEYGVADLLGKSIRERAVALISVAHPQFRSELLNSAKERRYVFLDQLEPKGIYPRHWEKTIQGRDGRRFALRPIKPIDEPKLSRLFYSLSDHTLYKRFMRVIKRVAHEELQYYLDVDYQRNVALVIETLEQDREPRIIAVAQYFVNERTKYAEVAFIVRDDWQGHGLGTQMFEHLIEIAKENGVVGFTAEVLETNYGMKRVFEKIGLEAHQEHSGTVSQLRMPFQAAESPQA